MSKFIFTEMQIVDVKLSSIEKCKQLSSTDIFQNTKNHLKLTANIRLEVCVDLRLMGNDFYTTQTAQVKEQIPELVELIEQLVSNNGFTKCSVSW